MSEKQAGARKISEQSVKEKTGKNWDEWFKILDEWCMKEKGHTLTAKYLCDQYRISPWWEQEVTIRYEWERRLRN